MERFLGVKVQRARRRYTPIVAARGESSGTGRLTTLSPDQSTAEIDVYLLARRSPGDAHPKEIRHLHRFTLRGVRHDDGSRPLLNVTGERSGRRRFTLTVYRDGRAVDSTTVRLPRSLAGRVTLLIAALLIAAAAAFGAVRYLGGTPDASEPSPVRESETSSPAPPQPASPERSVARDSTSQDSTSQDSTSQDSTSRDSTSRDSTSRDKATTDDETVTESAGGGEAETTRSENVAEDASADLQRPSADRDEPVEDVPPPPIRREETIYFLPDSVVLTSRAEAELRELAAFLTSPEHDVVDLRVAGHTALYGNEAGREMISVGRVDAVVTYLEKRGWDPTGRLTREALGATQPVPRATDRQHLNRRAEITITYRRDER